MSATLEDLAMMDESSKEFMQARIEEYNGRTAKARWETAQAAFVDLRQRILAKAATLGIAEDPPIHNALCHHLRNLSVGKYVAVLEDYPPEDWDEVTDLCEGLAEVYAEELQSLRILMLRVHWTFAPYQRKLRKAQQQELFRCFDLFEYGEPYLF
jgi:hypothetical protein